MSDYSTMIYIPLISAYLCSDCKCIGNRSTSCPACASTHLQGIAGVLDMETHTGQIANAPRGEDGRA